MKSVTLLLCMVSSLMSAVVAAEAYRGLLHDAHIHYDQDVWQDLSPDEAVELLQQSGIGHASVSATPTQGAAMLQRAAPDRVVAMLRPYKSWRHRYLWFRDPGLDAYLREHLAAAPYRGFGEFHVFGEDMTTPQVRAMVALARERGLVLLAHTDLAGMRHLLAMSDSVVVLWAHGGFDVPLEVLRELLQRYPQLHIELSLREGLLDADDRLQPAWQQLFSEYPSRFLVGMDTYKPSRWAQLPELVETTREWLGQLPQDVAAALAWQNFDRLLLQQR